MTKAKKTKMGTFLLTMFVTGTIVGSGIYMLPASLARLGSIGLLAWVMTTIGAIFLALVFAKMGTLYPTTGGPYTYAHAEFGNYIGFQSAYCYWIGAFVGNASLIPPTIGYLSFFFPHVQQYNLLIQLLFLWFFAIVNLFGVRKVGIINAIATVCKFVPILVVAFLGWRYFHPTYITHAFNVSPLSNTSAFTLAATLTLWSFIGVEAATVPAGDVLKPRRTIPIATIAGTLIAAVAYVITCTSIMGMIPMGELATCQYPFAAAAKIILGERGACIVTLGGLFALLGGLNAWTLLASQVPMAAANDELFPKIFAKKNKYGVPAWGIIITSIIISFLLILSASEGVIKQFEILILAATTMQVIPYIYTTLAELAYMIRHKKTAANFKTHVFIAVIGTIFSCYALIGAGTKILLIVAFFVILSVPLYLLLFFQKRRKRNQ